MNIGKNLKKIREHKNMTQHELATKLTELTGTNIITQTISYWENGRQINADLLEDIAQALGVDIIELLYGTKEIYDNKIKRKDGLTDEDGKVMDLLIEAWDKYIKLPEQYPTEIDEFGQGIHICQNLLAIRIARRFYPKGWPVKTNK